MQVSIYGIQIQLQFTKIPKLTIPKSRLSNEFQYYYVNRLGNMLQIQIRPDRYYPMIPFCINHSCKTDMTTLIKFASNFRRGELHELLNTEAQRLALKSEK